MENSEKKAGLIARHAKIATVMAVMFGATSGIFGSLVEASSMVIGFWRLTIALPFFLLPVVMNKEKRQAMKEIAPKDYLWCFVTGAFLFGHFFSWFNAVKLTNIASASVLAALHPLVVLLVTLLVYRRKVSLKAVAAIGVALIGGAVIVGVDYTTFAGGSLKGDFLAFMAAMFMGLYFSVGDAVRPRVEGGTYVLLVFASCWVCFTLGIIFTNTPVLGYSVTDYIYIVAMAFMCQIGAHAVFNMCIGHVSSLYVSTWEAGDPVFATLFAIIFLRQIPTAYEIIGCVITVCALLYYNRQENKSAQ